MNFHWLVADDPEGARRELAEAGSHARSDGSRKSGFRGQGAGDPVLLAGDEGQQEVPLLEMATGVVDYLEFFLLNYFKPGLHEQTPAVQRGRQTFAQIGCASGHSISSLQNHRDRRVADLETVYDPDGGNFNHLFATATPLISIVDNHDGLPARKEVQSARDGFAAPAGGRLPASKAWRDQADGPL